MQKMKWGSYLVPLTKINSNWIKDLNIIARTIKLLQESIGVNLYDLALGNGFLDITQKMQAIHIHKLDKLDLIKIKNLYFKGHHQKVKRLHRR